MKRLSVCLYVAAIVFGGTSALAQMFDYRIPPNPETVAREKAAPAPYLATVRGNGADWSDCVWDLARNLLNASPYSHLQLDSSVGYQLYVGSGYWYTIRAHDNLNHHFDLMLMVSIDSGTCRVHFNGWDSVILRDTLSRDVVTMGRLWGGVPYVHVIRP